MKPDEVQETKDIIDKLLSKYSGEDCDPMSAATKPEVKIEAIGDTISGNAVLIHCKALTEIVFHLTNNLGLPVSYKTHVSPCGSLSYR